MRFDQLLYSSSLGPLRSSPLRQDEGPNPEVTAVVYDSRKVEPGALYVAVRGEHVDGHQFIPQALERGAVAVACLQDWAATHALSPEIAWLPVSDTRQALAELSASFFGHPDRELKLLGVTGTNGKTTITHLLTQWLQRLHVRAGWIGTLGAGYDELRLTGQYTTPFPPELQAWLSEMQTAGVQAVSMECSSHALAQHRLDALHFEVAVFTNLTQDHLDYHQTMERYAEAKQVLFARLLASEGLAVINLDDPWGEAFVRASRAPVLSYALEREADLKADQIVQHQAGLDAVLTYRGQSHRLRSPLPGCYNLSNLLAVVGALLGLGYDLEQILPHLASLQGVPGRLERVSEPEAAFAVYVDYAHTPDSLLNVLKTVRQFTPGRVLVVCGCGGDRDRGKRPLMARVAEDEADVVVLTSDNPRSEPPEQILAEMVAGLQRPERVRVEVDRRQGLAAALALAAPQDTVLIAGKGHETTQTIGTQKLPFDDRLVAREILKGEL